MAGADRRDRAQRFRRAVEGLLGVPATEGNELTVLRNGVEIFPAMLDAIAASRSTVDLCTYVYWTGDIAVRFADALCERARAGVRVRILLDAVGAYAMDRGLSDAMQDAGCDVRWFRPPTTWKVWQVNHRTHRKVLVCDEATAFTGGVGIAREWEGDARNPGEWRDTHVRVRGPAVDGLRAAFVANWAETGDPLFGDADRFPVQPQAGTSVVQVVRAPAQIGWSEMSTTLAALLQLAQHQVRITTAYFVPDERFLGMLLDTARRGVDVDVLVPGAHADKRVVQAAGQADYAPMLAAGIRVWEYQPTMLHAKVITVDATVAYVGSANFDQRSLLRNDEAGLVVLDPDVVATLDGHFAEDLARAELVRAQAWRRRGLLQRTVETVSDAVDEQL